MIDIEAIAREADLIDPRDVWRDLPRDYTDGLSKFAALVLEKAALEIGGLADKVYDHAKAPYLKSAAAISSLAKEIRS